MGAIVLAIAVVLSMVLPFAVVHRYASLRKIHWFGSTLVLLTFFCCFSIMFVLPLDMSSTFYRECLVETQPQENVTTPPATNWTVPLVNVTLTNGTDTGVDGGLGMRRRDAPLVCEPPMSYVGGSVLLNFWRITFWMIMLLTWVLLPLYSSFLTAGGFTWWERFKASVKENLLLYITLGTVFGILFVVIAVTNKLDLAGIEGIMIASANTWGLFLVVLLLGVGLVEVPRSLWRNGNMDGTLRRLEFQAAKLRQEMEDADEDLDGVIDDVRSASGRILFHEPLRQFVDIVVSKCPEGSVDVDETDFQEGSARDDNNDVRPTRKSLATLHARIIKAVRARTRTHALYDRCLANAFEVQDIIASRTNSNRVIKHSIASLHGQPPRSEQWVSTFGKLEWFWKVKCHRPFHIVLFLICVAMSIVLIWSECTFFKVHPQLSVYAIVIHEFGDHFSFIPLELVSFITTAYMCVCTYSTVFRMRIFNWYYLASNQLTDESSLLFCATLLSRLAFPLGLNYLSIVHMDGRVETVLSEETDFTMVAGKMEVVGFIEQGFNVYFPIIIVIVALLAYFHACSRVLSLFGHTSFIDDNDGSMEMVIEGREYISRERRKRDSGGGNAITDTRERWSVRRQREREQTRSGGGGAGESDGERGRRLKDRDARKPRAIQQILSKYRRSDRIDDDDDDDDDDLRDSIAESTVASASAASPPRSRSWFGRMRSSKSSNSKSDSIELLAVGSRDDDEDSPPIAASARSFDSSPPPPSRWESRSRYDTDTRTSTTSATASRWDRRPNQPSTAFPSRSSSAKPPPRGFFDDV